MKSPAFVYLATDEGVLVYGLEKDDLTETGRGLTEGSVRAIAVHPESPEVAYFGCALRGMGLFRSVDAGGTFESLGFDDVWVTAIFLEVSPPNKVWIGTEPPMVHVDEGGEGEFKAVDSIDQLPSRGSWTFFYEPFKAGHISSLAIHPLRPERVFAGVEVGALIYSWDGGRVWREALVGYDLHSVAIDPLDSDHVLAAANEGLFESMDAGETWNESSDLGKVGMSAVSFDPTIPERVYAYGSGMFRSENRGATWRVIGADLPPAHFSITFAVAPKARGVVLCAGDEGRTSSSLFLSEDGGDTWTCLRRGFPKIRRVAIGTSV